MKAVLMSIRPQWCEKIFNGSKSIEVRKSRPSIPTPFKVYVYETKGKTKYWSQPMPMPYTEGRGKVIGSFVCDRIDEFDSEYSEWAYACAPTGIPCAMPMSEGTAIEICKEKACLTHEDIVGYFGDEEWRAYFWNITEPKLFDKPRELSEFYRSLPENVLENGEYDCRKAWDVLCIDAPEGGDYCAECPFGGRVPLTRPPMSWCYIETDER